MPPQQISAKKLTKKELKTAQFRDRSKKKETATGEEAAVGVAEAADVHDTPASHVAEADIIESERESKKKRKGKAKNSSEAEEGVAISVAADESLAKAKRKKAESDEVQGEIEGKDTGKKRKRDANLSSTTTSSSSSEAKRPSKKRFTEDGKVEEVEVPVPITEVSVANMQEEDKKDDRRYIVFVGNMSFQSTTEQIAKHFASHCNETPSVRLLTKKGDPQKLAQLSKSKQKSIAKGKAADPSAPVSKGCAFVEFKSASALQKALQYHHTLFQGRNINVELTAGGGGKGDGRKEKIRKKNAELESERQKLHEKYIKGAKKEKKDGDDEGKGGTFADKAEDEKKPAAPQWGPKAAANKDRRTTKIPKWAASGANAVRLSG